MSSPDEPYISDSGNRVYVPVRKMDHGTGKVTVDWREGYELRPQHLAPIAQANLALLETERREATTAKARHCANTKLFLFWSAAHGACEAGAPFDGVVPADHAAYAGEFAYACELLFGAAAWNLPDVMLIHAFLKLIQSGAEWNAATVAEARRIAVPVAGYTFTQFMSEEGRADHSRRKPPHNHNLDTTEGRAARIAELEQQCAELDAKLTELQPHMRDNPTRWNELQAARGKTAKALRTLRANTATLETRQAEKRERKRASDAERQRERTADPEAREARNARDRARRQLRKGHEPAT